MVNSAYSEPKARVRHFCDSCTRQIYPGETYSRFVDFDAGTLGAFKACLHCQRCGDERRRRDGEEEWDGGLLVEWLTGGYPDLAKAMLNGWRDETGQLVPVPFSDQRGADIPDLNIYERTGSDERQHRQ